MNENVFVLPNDGFYHVAPLGEFRHAGAGVVQVIDAVACRGMCDNFSGSAGDANFPGVLVDFDHESLHPETRSEAAGWIEALECRADGLYGRIRWSDSGAAAVRGGRFRFLSPVWRRSDCEDIGVSAEGEPLVRPSRLLNAALTNDPNLHGAVPLSNSNADQDRLPGGTGIGVALGLRLLSNAWTNEARVVSLEVRRAKAAARKAKGSSKKRKVKEATTPDEAQASRVKKAARRMREKYAGVPSEQIWAEEEAQRSVRPLLERVLTYLTSTPAKLSGGSVAGKPTPEMRSFVEDMTQPDWEGLPVLDPSPKWVARVPETVFPMVEGESDDDRAARVMAMMGEQLEAAGGIDPAKVNPMGRAHGAAYPDLYVGGWFPRGTDGVDQDPHFGGRSFEAPYGWSDADGKPRTEPLYDFVGIPIIPRSEGMFLGRGWEAPFETQADRNEEARIYAEDVDKALEKWGLFGLGPESLDTARRSSFGSASERTGEKDSLTVEDFPAGSAAGPDEGELSSDEVMAEIDRRARGVGKYPDKSKPGGIWVWDGTNYVQVWREKMRKDGSIANSWSDAARAASLAVRRARSMARRGASAVTGAAKSAASALSIESLTSKAAAMRDKILAPEGAELKPEIVARRKARGLGRIPGPAKEAAVSPPLTDAERRGEGPRAPDGGPIDGYFERQAAAGKTVFDEPADSVLRPEMGSGQEPGRGVDEMEELLLSRPNSAEAHAMTREEKVAGITELIGVYSGNAVDAFKAEYGRDPVSGSDIAEAEELGNVPEAFRTNGDPIGDEALIERILTAVSPPLTDAERRGEGPRAPDGGPIDRYFERRAAVGKTVFDEPADSVLRPEMGSGQEPGRGVDEMEELLSHPNSAEAQAMTREEMVAGITELNGVYWGNAVDAFMAEYGRDPVSDSDIAEAEELGKVPEAFRTDGDPIGDEALVERVLEGFEREAAVFPPFTDAERRGEGPRGPDGGPLAGYSERPIKEAAVSPLDDAALETSLESFVSSGLEGLSEEDAERLEGTLLEMLDEEGVGDLPEEGLDFLRARGVDFQEEPGADVAPVASGRLAGGPGDPGLLREAIDRGDVGQPEVDDNVPAPDPEEFDKWLQTDEGKEWMKKWQTRQVRGRRLPVQYAMNRAANDVEAAKASYRAGLVANIGWSAAARGASLVSRMAKSSARKLGFLREIPSAGREGGATAAVGRQIKTAHAAGRLPAFAEQAMPAEAFKALKTAKPSWRGPGYRRVGFGVSNSARASAHELIPRSSLADVLARRKRGALRTNVPGTGVGAGTPAGAKGPGQQRVRHVRPVKRVLRPDGRPVANAKKVSPEKLAGKAVVAGSSYDAYGNFIGEEKFNAPPPPVQESGEVAAAVVAKKVKKRIRVAAAPAKVELLNDPKVMGWRGSRGTPLNKEKTPKGQRKFKSTRPIDYWVPSSWKATRKNSAQGHFQG